MPETERVPELVGPDLRRPPPGNPRTDLDLREVDPPRQPAVRDAQPEPTHPRVPERRADDTEPRNPEHRRVVRRDARDDKHRAAGDRGPIPDRLAETGGLAVYPELHRESPPLPERGARKVRREARREE